MLTKIVQEGGPYHNEIQRDEKVQEMITFQPNSQDQQSTNILLDTSIVDAFHGEIVAKEDDFRAKNVQPDLVGDKNEVQSNSEVVLATQLMLVGTSIGRQVDEAIQLNLIGMLVEYGTLGLIYEVGINIAQIGDVGDDSIQALDYY